MSKNEQHQSFREQVAEHNVVVKTIVSLAVFTGYGAGTVKAHTQPMLRRIGNKLSELTPESAKVIGHAYRSAVKLGLEEESFRKAERAAARAARQTVNAAKAAWQGITA